MPPVTGIYLIAELAGPAAARIREVQERHDPKLARTGAPHVTLAGSSGVGPVRADTTAAELERCLRPVARAASPLVLPFGIPERFMQTNIVHLPLDPNGPVRALHEAIARSGLRFGPTRFTFTPHATLSFYRTLDAATARALLAVRIDDPAEITRFTAYRHRDPLPPVKVVEFVLGEETS